MFLSTHAPQIAHSLSQFEHEDHVSVSLQPPCGQESHGFFDMRNRELYQGTKSGALQVGCHGRQHFEPFETRVKILQQSPRETTAEEGDIKLCYSLTMCVLRSAF